MYGAIYNLPIPLISKDIFNNKSYFKLVPSCILTTVDTGKSSSVLFYIFNKKKIFILVQLYVIQYLKNKYLDVKTSGKRTRKIKHNINGIQSILYSY